jgi:hypothetical protein
MMTTCKMGLTISFRPNKPVNSRETLAANDEHEHHVNHVWIRRGAFGADIPETHGDVLVEAGRASDGMGCDVGGSRSRWQGSC